MAGADGLSNALSEGITPFGQNDGSERSPLVFVVWVSASDMVAVQSAMASMEERRTCVAFMMYCGDSPSARRKTPPGAGTIRSSPMMSATPDVLSPIIRAAMYPARSWSSWTLDTVGEEDSQSEGTLSTPQSVSSRGMARCAFCAAATTSSAVSSFTAKIAVWRGSVVTHLVRRAILAFLNVARRAVLAGNRLADRNGLRKPPAGGAIAADAGDGRLLDRIARRRVEVEDRAGGRHDDVE